MAVQPSILVACSKPEYIGKVATRRAPGIKMVRVMEVGTLIDEMGWYPARLLVHLPLLSSLAP